MIVKINNKKNNFFCKNEIYCFKLYIGKIHMYTSSKVKSCPVDLRYHWYSRQYVNRVKQNAAILLGHQTIIEKIFLHGRY